MRAPRRGFCTRRRLDRRSRASSLTRTVGGFGALAATRTTRARRPKTFLDIISIRCFDAPGTIAPRCVVIPHVVEHVVADMLRPPRVFYASQRNE